MKTYPRIVLILAAISPVIGSAAIAQETSVRRADTPARMMATADAAFGGAVAIGDNDLGKVAGREDTGAMVASATQRNTVANNSVTGTSTTGSVRIDGNAFQNLQGLAVISANSGNNVAMNSAMNVTVNIAPR